MVIIFVSDTKDVNTHKLCYSDCRNLIAFPKISK